MVKGVQSTSVHHLPALHILCFIFGNAITFQSVIGLVSDLDSIRNSCDVLYLYYCIYL